MDDPEPMLVFEDQENNIDSTIKVKTKKRKNAYDKKPLFENELQPHSHYMSTKTRLTMNAINRRRNSISSALKELYQLLSSATTKQTSVSVDDHPDGVELQV